MKQLIYYPGFEVTDLNWLKFALLYIDKLCPITPASADSHLSDLFRQIETDTDLIDVYRPQKDEGATATLDSLEYVDKILRAPKRYSTFLGQDDILQRWRQPTTQNYLIFSEKYAVGWEDYCIKNHLGVKSNHGVCVNRQLAMIYMTLLAQAIADARGISPITDDRNLDSYYIFARRPNSDLNQRVSLAQGTLQIKLPVALSQIDIDKIIDLRNKPNFKKNLKAFHYELDRFLDNTEQAPTTPTTVDFVNTLGPIWKDFTDNLLVLGLETTTFGLGVWLTVASPTATGITFVKEIAGGLSLIVGSTIAVKSTWRHTETKRNSRKYLADISKLGR